jgi:hypothetical protein
MNNRFVNFIGIGGQKCASTWLYDILEDHPQACLSVDKELDFFSSYWDRGYEWYESKFSNADTTKKVIGEVSPSYLCNIEAPARLKKYNQDTKIIVILRHPVDRAFSNHKHNVRQGFVLSDDVTFEASIQNNPTYVEHGMYYSALKYWLEAFPKEQILIILFDDILKNADKIAKEVYTFLNISTEHVSEALNKKSNESAAVANIRLALFVDKLRKSAKRRGLMPGWNIMRNIGLRYIYRSINQKNIELAIPKMLDKTRHELLDIFRSDTESLSALLKVNLDSWKK